MLRVCCMAAVALAVSAAAAQRAVACTAATTKALVRTFAADYSKGRVAASDRMFAPEPYFQWFSSSAPVSRLGGKAYDRATLAAYFRARARAHERLVLTRLSAKYDPNRNLVNFSGELVRSADDMPAARHPFKGAAACRSGGPTLIVWSM
jgi:hypothetical protein